MTYRTVRLFQFDSWQATKDQVNVVFDLERIYSQTLSSLAVESILKESLERSKFEGGVDLFAVGKAAESMSLAVCRYPNVRVHRGFVLTKHGHLTDAPELRPLKLCQAGHPVPDQAGLVSTREAVRWLLQGQSDELLVLLSGGASSLLTWPSPPLTLQDTRLLNQALLASGLPIQEMNCLRKHLSEVAGGQLGRRCRQVYRRIHQWTLVDICAPQLSPAELLSAVGSGPFLSDPTTVAQATAVLKFLKPGLPVDVLERCERALHETPFDLGPVQSQVLATHQTVWENARRLVGESFFHDPAWPIVVTGDIVPVAEAMATVAKRMVLEKKSGILVATGEPTVQLKTGPTGLGGRCQELALRFAKAVDGIPGIAFLAGSTDGSDGPTSVAGAKVTGETWQNLGAVVGLEALQSMLDQHDSTHALDLLPNTLLRTGPTGQNLNDLFLLAVEDRSHVESKSSSCR